MISLSPRACAKIRRRARAPIGEDRLEQAGDAFCPRQRALRFGDQILPDLDQRIGQSARSVAMASIVSPGRPPL